MRNVPQVILAHGWNMRVERDEAFNRGGRRERPRRTRRETCICITLDICALFGVALEVPAGLISGAGEEGIGAGLRFRWIEDEFCFAVLLRYGVVGGDGDLSKGSAVGGEAVAEDRVVDGVGQQGQAQKGREGNEDSSLR
jgi:hypothetical protein